MFSSRSLFVLLSFLAFASATHAQITNVTNDTSTPVAGAGHDYIHLLNETVNPANGSLSIRINLPTAKGRGITLPISIGYDSNVVNHLVPQQFPHLGQVIFADNHSTISRGGMDLHAPGRWHHVL